MPINYSVGRPPSKKPGVNLVITDQRTNLKINTAIIPEDVDSKHVCELVNGRLFVK